MRSETKSQNGSIAEEIEEDIDELSIEADDLLHSEKSAVSLHPNFTILMSTILISYPTNLISYYFGL